VQIILHSRLSSPTERKAMEKWLIPGVGQKNIETNLEYLDNSR
jgi:hypothetical protein